jgi:hypothetical protein
MIEKEYSTEYIKKILLMLEKYEKEMNKNILN